ncbi:MAG: branched-chain amino acid ABC transporter permease [Alphaproteobacteria bacterium]
MEGLLAYAVFFATLVGIYGLLAVGLNVQWGYAGLFNIGIAAFFAVGAYTSAIVTGPASADHLGGFGLPLAAGWLAAAAVAALLALVAGIAMVRLREDYLAIASIGIAEIVRLLLKNEEWLTNGVRGIGGIVHPWRDGGTAGAALYLGLVLAALAALWLLSERLRRSPWGRAVRAQREDERAAMALGRDVARLRLEAFVIGSAAMGLAGAAYAHFVGFISPEAFDPTYATFLVWVMLIAGGSGSNAGAILGTFVIWVVWSATEYAVNLLPAELTARGSALRLLLVGLVLEGILLWRPRGLLPEPRSVDPALTRGDGRPSPGG